MTKATTGDPRKTMAGMPENRKTMEDGPAQRDVDLFARGRVRQRLDEEPRDEIFPLGPQCTPDADLASGKPWYRASSPGSGSVMMIRTACGRPHRGPGKRETEDEAPLASAGAVTNEIAIMRLHQQWLQLASLFDCLEDVLAWVKDRDGRYCWVNRAFLINYAMDHHQGEGRAGSEDLLGKTDYDLSPTFLADQFRLDDEHVLAGKPIMNRIELVGQPDESSVWNVTNKIPFVDAAGTIIGTAGITRRLNTTREDIVPGTEFGPVLAYMRDHYHSPITNHQLARMAHMSVRAFERKFRSSFHLTPQKYLRKLQMRMASRALVYTSQPLAEVALSSGFVDQSHFTREFRRHFGRTPRDYRKHYASGVGDAVPVTNSAVDER